MTDEESSVISQGDTHLHHVGFVPFEDLDGLGCFWINDKDAGVTSLSYQPLPAPGRVHRQNTQETAESSPFSAKTNGAKLSNRKWLEDPNGNW